MRWQVRAAWEGEIEGEQGRRLQRLARMDSREIERLSLRTAPRGRSFNRFIVEKMKEATANCRGVNTACCRFIEMV